MHDLISNPPPLFRKGYFHIDFCLASFHINLKTWHDLNLYKEEKGLNRNYKMRKGRQHVLRDILTQRKVMTSNAPLISLPIYITDIKSSEKIHLFLNCFNI
jgi:hypothetical protein